MSPTSVTFVERVAFEGPLPVVAIVVIAAALTGLVAWSLRRERSVLGAPTAALFCILRCAALAVALWLLLAPTTIRSQRSSTRPSIAFAVDVSQSMQTVDRPEPADDLRWRLAVNGGDERSPVVSADRALAAVTIAEHRLAKSVESLKNEQPEGIALEEVAAAQQAIERTRGNIRAVIDGLSQAASPDDRQPDAETIEQQADQALQILGGADFRSLAAIAVASNKSSPLTSGWRESLGDLERQVSAVRRRLAELSRAIGEHEARSATKITRGDGAAATRLERAAKFVETVDAELLRPLRSKADVRIAVFDRQLSPLADEQTLAAALAGEPSGDRKQNASAQNDLPGTDLATALQQLQQQKQEQPLAAVFLITDAAHNQSGGPDPRQVAAQMDGTPVYVVLIGAAHRVRDVDLKAVGAPGVAMKGDEAVVEATVEAFQCQGESLRVELLRDGTVVQDRELELDAAQTVERARFNVALDEVGTARFQVRVAPLDGELSDENNYEQFEINVTRNHIDLLLADELPRWEYRYLAQLFRRDEKVACDELLFRPRLIATGHRQESKAFPATVDDWNRYDVVLLGDVSSERLPVAAQQSLAEFVRERGGTLVVIAGDESMPQAFSQQPLEDLLPVSRIDGGEQDDARDGYSFHVTEAGWRHQALMIADTQESTRIAWEFISRHAPLDALSPFRRPRPSAHTLLAAVSRTSLAVPRTSLDIERDATNNALLCWQAVGRGRVVYLASPETYRLRFLHGDRLHYRFWGQLLRWAIAADLAAGTELVNIRTDRPEYRQGDEVQVAVRLGNENGEAVVGAQIEAAALGSGDSKFVVPLRPDDSVPGRYTGSFEHLPNGVYRVEPKGAEVERLLPAGESQAVAASFTVRTPLNREALETRSDRALAGQIAAASGGQVLPPTALAEVLALTDLEPSVSEKTDTLPLWIEWKFLWIVFGCLFVEWAARKRMGLS